MSTIKDANGKELTDTEDIKKRWQEQKNYTKKILMTRTTMMVWSLTKSQTSWSVKFKWALGRITMNKASGGDGIPVELFQILRDAVKVLHLICQQIWKTQQ